MQKKRTTIKRFGIEAEAIRSANKVLQESGLRICRYSGELLDLNETNFSKTNDKSFWGYPYQSVSKFGHSLYNEGKLEVKDTDKPYQRFNGKKRVTTA